MEMNNSASALIKFAALIGGATVGALIANWLDEQLMTRALRRAEYDRSRYEQGLGPVTITRTGENTPSDETSHE